MFDELNKLYQNIIAGTTGVLSPELEKNNKITYASKSERYKWYESEEDDDDKQKPEICYRYNWYRC